MSPESLLSSFAVKNFFGMALGLSRRSPPTAYGIRRREKAIPVSNLQPVNEGALARVRVYPVSACECIDLGEPLRKRLLGEGERTPKDMFRS